MSIRTRDSGIVSPVLLPSIVTGMKGAPAEDVQGLALGSIEKLVELIEVWYWLDLAHHIF